MAGLIERQLCASPRRKGNLTQASGKPTIPVSIFLIPKRLGLCYEMAMPTIIRAYGFRVTIYPNDHRPPHVHVIGAGGEAVIEIGKAAQVIRVAGFKARDLTLAISLVEDNAALLLREWENIHGNRE
ncbi:DUF4160 domain-containing protein [Nguyenibacter vanlangensis]|uniref:DUF4160 domain-containing protein n=1 Tax=Nguyenibacter vanlangensis TaxID=1216886 RepID=A0A7Y7IT98_9PROT|nr:DUF4160 domain-containing protein [Nguyenibacter vanlangensis]NVN09703.1 DUF4160 domain-containing protein [Nguyenibacter vanlangensis]